MQVQTGYIYHIKDEFFDKINDKGLMINLDQLILLSKMKIFYGLFH